MVTDYINYIKEKGKVNIPHPDEREKEIRFRVLLESQSKNVNDK
jgi:hypothetical protein